ncbi:TonB-dependent siderophore receptor [Sphingobium cloacae]|uniref:TonB-dependent siderophore receptor n=1 Tax=Sphingobium cloacae TaxID=120107 RepID=UPI001E500D80|nr:TonB-dependent siderophore receptor [Sphingobium cloacae]
MRRSLLGAVFMGTAAAGAIAAPAMAQAQTVAERSFNIPAQPLADALVAFADQSGYQVTADGGMIRGVRTNGVNGTLAPTQALGQLLSGTGFTFRISGNMVTVERAPKTSEGAVQLGPVRVEGASAATGTSHYPGMSENTGSYTTPAVTAGSKIEQSLREVPRSITVLSRQQLDDQRFTQFQDAIQQLPGVTFYANEAGWGDQAYSVRGFSLTGITVDGSPIKTGIGDSSTNTGLAKYDNIQLVRGPEGLFTGNGGPGGSINLVRKRPLDTFQLKTALSAGSWNNYYGEVDISAPLDTAGTIRARAVASYNDTEKFYDNSHRRYLTLYGIVEADATDRTTFSLGASYDKVSGSGQDSPPTFPRYSTGEPLPIPRSTGYPTGVRRDSESTNIFGNIRHDFNSSWAAKLNLSYTHVDGFIAPVWYVGAVDPQTGRGSRFGTPTTSDYEIKALAADFNIQGDVQLFGRTHKLVIGADYVRTKNDSTQMAGGTVRRPDGASVGTIEIEWPNFDSSQYAFSLDQQTLRGTTVGKNTQYGVYLYGQIQLLDPLKLVLGGRLSGYRNEVVGWTGSSRMKNSSIFIPYAALQYDFARDFTAYLTYTRGYEDQSNRYTAKHEPIGPTSSNSFELGIKGEHWGGRLNSNVTVYRTLRKNFAVLLNADQQFNDANPGRTCCYAGDGRFEGKGVEVDISGELLPRLQVNIGYTLDDSKVDYGSDAGNRISTDIPKHSFRAWVRYQLPGSLSGLALGGGVRAQSSFYSEGTVRTWNPTGGTDGTGAFDGPSVPYSFVEPGRSVWDLFAQYQLTSAFNLALNVNNIFDKKYFARVGGTSWNNVYGSPRNVMVTLRGSF